LILIQFQPLRDAPPGYPLQGFLNADDLLALLPHLYNIPGFDEIGRDIHL
jgi:hypothetical protein